MFQRYFGSIKSSFISALVVIKFLLFCYYDYYYYYGDDDNDDSLHLILRNIFLVTQDINQASHSCWFLLETYAIRLFFTDVLIVSPQHKLHCWQESSFASLPTPSQAYSSESYLQIIKTKNKKLTSSISWSKNLPRSFVVPKYY